MRNAEVHKYTRISDGVVVEAIQLGWETWNTVCDFVPKPAFVSGAYVNESRELNNNVTEYLGLILIVNAITLTHNARIQRTEASPKLECGEFCARGGRVGDPLEVGDWIVKDSEGFEIHDTFSFAKCFNTIL